MDVFYSMLSWGSPVGLGLFFCLSGLGAAFVFWGIAQFKKHD